MAVRWSWWSTLLVLAAVVLPGATSAWSSLPPLQDPGHGDVAEVHALRQAASDAPPRGVPLFDAAMHIVPRVSLIETAFEAESLESRLLGPVVTAEHSLLEQAQVVSLYGYPDIPGLGDLGRHTPDAAAVEVARMAAEYDALNGERDAIGAMHLIVSLAQTVPLEDGSYLNRLDHATIAAYVEAARRHSVLLILDTQLGMAEPVEEARRLEAFLEEPFVHLALDPEFAMRASGGVPGDVIGSIDATQVNAVQRYLAGLVREHSLPQKLLVVHQFRDDMLTHSGPWRDTPEVARIINFDGWGPLDKKLTKYHEYATARYAEHAGIKLFDGWDIPMLTPRQVLALPRQPDLVVYQ